MIMINAFYQKPNEDGCIFIHKMFFKFMIFGQFSWEGLTWKIITKQHLQWIFDAFVVQMILYLKIVSMNSLNEILKCFI
jgi:hypothetical protein